MLKMSNKSRASSFCPLIDTGVPKGDYYVQVKKAKIPFHIVEMGTGTEGKINLLIAKTQQAQKDIQTKAERRAAAERAFLSGTGDLTEVLKKLDIDTNPHYSAKDEARERELHPGHPLKHSFLKRCYKATVSVLKEIWDSAQQD